MNSKVIIYFVGTLNPETLKLKDFLKTIYKHVYETSHRDEIEQGARQQGKGVLVFSDPKFALTFMDGPAISRTSLYSALVIDKVGTYGQDVINKFKLHNLNFFNPKTVTGLHNEIKKFVEGGHKELSADEIQFNVNFDKDK